MTGKTVVLKTSAAATTGTNAGSEVVIPPGCRGIIVYADVTAASGTSPTLNLYIQDGFRAIASTDAAGGNTTGSYFFQDYISFTQITTAADKIARKDFTGEEESAATDVTLTAGQLRNGPMSNIIRAKWVVAGTNPSFTFSVIAHLVF